MFILDLVNNCNNPALANILIIIKRFINILQIFVPIIAMVFLAVKLIKMTMDPENKKNFPRIKNWLIAIIVVFALPVIVDTLMNILGENYSISACWNYAEQVQTIGQQSNYNDSNDEEKNNSILIDSDDYDDASPSNNNSSGSSNSNSSNNSNSSTPVGNGSVIFIGDSRTVQMKAHVGEGNDIWSCKGSMGLNWMKSTGVPNIASSIKSGSKIVILMGVNDLYQPSAYISYINSNASEWASKGATTYFVSVNPCDGSYNHLNDDISSFNSKLKAGLNSNIRYIDSNSYLYSVGFTTTDGLHYDQATSRKIYNYVKSNI